MHRFVVGLIFLGVSVIGQAGISYSFSITPPGPLNPINAVIYQPDYIPADGPFAFTPFTVTSTLGDSWTLDLSVARPSQGCMSFAVLPTVFGVGGCGASNFAAGAGLLTLFDPASNPLPTSPGTYAYSSLGVFQPLVGSQLNFTNLNFQLVVAAPEASASVLTGFGLLLLPLAIRFRRRLGA